MTNNTLTLNLEHNNTTNTAPVVAIAPVAEVPVAAPQISEVTFASFQLPVDLKNSLDKMNFTSPTEIQQKSIPVALQGKDILGSSQTGSGKTAAFSIPLMARLILNPQERAIVMTPTRELAIQVMEVITKLVPQNNNIRRALLIGGDSMFKQVQQLKANPRIVVGTPGRIMDHIKRKMLDLSQTRFLVLDETDRMLDIGMGEQIEQIVNRMPKERQTLLFSATFSSTIVKASQKYLIDPVRISVGTSNMVAPKIKQENVFVDGARKYAELKTQLEAREGSVVIFVKTKMGADKLADKLTDDNYEADAIHGDLHQRKREKVITAFRNKQFRVLVATDVAARGLDIPHIKHVVNYDLPQCPEDYIHRIGRTARAGAEGSAISFISSDEKGKWRAIAKLINPGEKLGAEFEGGDDKGRDYSRGRKRSFGGGYGGKSNFRNRDQRYDRRENEGYNGGGERRREFGRYNENHSNSSRYESLTGSEKRGDNRGNEGGQRRETNFNRENNDGERNFNGGGERRREFSGKLEGGFRGNRSNSSGERRNYPRNEGDKRFA
ncbi:MAG TPA: ATP-dependent RNA helicase [Alphaproteobacteria bacterium]|nr:ATP-dependent RNA helicase [Alphaproteobacteria bacterium]